MSRRKKLLIRTLVSVVMTSAVVMLSIVLLFLMLGYRFNREQGSITQGGLVQFITTPPGAHVTVGKAHLANVTPSKITLTPGTYPVTIEKQGYHTWNKTVTIGAGTVTWLNTARLVPTSVSSKRMAEYVNVQSVAFSPRARYVALVQDTSKPVVTIDTIDQATVTKSVAVELPVNTYSPGTTHAFTIDTWGRAERYILMRHAYDGKTEWIVVDSQDVTRSRPISSLNGVTPMFVTFDQRNTSDVLALYDDGTIRHVQPQTGEIRQYPLYNIASFSYVNDQTIVFATKPVNGTVSVGYYTLDATTSRPITSYRAEPMVLVAGAKYFSDYYFSIAHGNAIVIYTTDTLPQSDSKEKWPIAVHKTVAGQDAIQTLVSHANGRLVVATSGTAQLSYDLELEHLSTVKIERAATALTKPLLWFDDFNFISTIGGTLRMYEYDGGNQHDILQTVEGAPASVSDNNKYMYTLQKTDKGFALQAIKMILE